jgi:hypothetical protein
LCKRLVHPLLIAVGVLIAAIVMLPPNVDAGQPIDEREEPVLTEAGVESQANVIFGSDVALTPVGGQLPEIAANGSFVAMVYERNNLIFMRAVKATEAKWGGTAQVHNLAGAVPRLAFRPGSASTVHVVWTGSNAGGQPERVIRHRVCTLATLSINCSGAVTNIASTAAGQLKTPDIVIAPDGSIHVAWYDTNTGKIKTARSTNNGASWATGATIDVVSTAFAGEPVLAATTNQIHLAFKDKVSGSGRVEYRRLNKSNHSINLSRSHSAVLFPSFSNESSNLAIAAAGSNVYLAWANQNNSNPRLYGLVGVQYTSEGSSSGQVVDIPSNTALNPGNPTGKAAQDGATPPVEDGLRPSLAITTSNRFAAVWQERGNVTCNPLGGGGPFISRIHYASPSNTWGVAGTVTGISSEYKVDPDIAVDSNGTHIVFMKASDPGDCTGAAFGGYRIFYRGPFTATTDEDGGIYLPIVLK